MKAQFSTRQLRRLFNRNVRVVCNRWGMWLATCGTGEHNQFSMGRSFSVYEALDECWAELQMLNSNGEVIRWK